jgi:predicted dehydrogenase
MKAIPLLCRLMSGIVRPTSAKRTRFFLSPSHQRTAKPWENNFRSFVMPVTYNYEYPKRLRTGFIGCGGHAYRNIYPTFQYAPVNLVAVCDLDPARAAACAKVFGAERNYSDHIEMLEREELDVVFIVTNVDENGLPRYPKLAIDCLRAGVHAWIEKPPASSSAEIREMIRVSSETKRHVSVGFKKMFFPANVKAKEIASRPDFGPITSITARYPQSLPPFEDRSDPRKMISFLDHIVHPHSVLRLLGGPIDWIFVNRNSRIGSATVSIRFTSGAAGNLHLSPGQSPTSFLERLEIIGDGENLVIENNIRLVYYRRSRSRIEYGRSADYFDALTHDSAPLYWEPEFSLGQLYNKGIFLLGYAPEVIQFTTRLLDGKGPAYGTLEDALEFLQIYEAYLLPDQTIHRIKASS